MKKKIIVCGGARQVTTCEVFEHGIALVFASEKFEDIAELLLSRAFEGRNVMFLNACYDYYYCKIKMEETDKVLDFDTEEPLELKRIEGSFL